MIADKQLNLCIFFRNNKDAPVHIQVNATPEDIDQLQRFFNDHIFGDIDYKTVLGKHRVVSHNAITGIIGNFCVTAVEGPGISFRKLL
ncbi:hypothetical protein SDC9_196146 [bioreactor metagenome]|uniref:Uncharacterized protein n=1 Tax=bioreactor metagenome TaxID=1076179 RepID=A0A645IC91_9ZZZZ